MGGSWFIQWESAGDSKFFHGLVRPVVGEFWERSGAAKSVNSVHFIEKPPNSSSPIWGRESSSCLLGDIPIHGKLRKVSDLSPTN